jgi:hypothetical protein
MLLCIFGDFNVLKLFVNGNVTKRVALAYENGIMAKI